MERAVITDAIPPLPERYMDYTRTLELALETLEKRRAEVEAEIEEVRELMGGIPRQTITKPVTPTLVVVKRRSKTAAERTAQSEAMKKYWAAKKTQVKVSTSTQPIPARAKRRPKTAAEKKVLSLKMKEAWARRRAAAAKK